MHCLYCGDCCEKMSPLTAPEPCPHIVREESFVFCSVYSKRPEECVTHSFPAIVCPIGAEKLGITTDKVRRERILKAHALILKGINKNA